MRVAILTDETGWHTRQLQQALRTRGASGRCVDLADCDIDTSAPGSGLLIPGFGRGLPEAAIVRGVAGGSFEQVTKRLGVLHALELLGVPVYNGPRAIERCVDKSMTSLLLHAAGVPTPPSWATESEARARRLLMREEAAGRALVMKPLFGSQGKGLARVGRVEGEPVAMPPLSRARGLAYLQRFLPSDDAQPEGFDWRVLVVGGRAIAAMRRVSAHWVHNVAQGARCEPAALEPALAATAEAAAAALQTDYAGVDLMPGPDGRPWVLEVNGVAAWRGLQRVTPFPIAQALVDDLIDRRMGGATAGLVPARRA